MTMALVHILPETVTSYQNYIKAHEAEHGHDHRLRILAAGNKEDDNAHGGEFPTAYVLFLVGFWIMQLLDQVIFKKIDAKKPHSKPK